MGKWWFNGGLMGFNDGFMGFYGIHPLKRLQKNELENHHVEW